MRNTEVIRDGIKVSTDPSLLDVDAIHDYLSNHTHWAKNRPYETVRQSVKNSFCFGVYERSTQIGFARVITDFAVFAFILDVYVLEQYQGRGLGKLLLQTITEHPALQAELVWSLVTKDAHGLYSQYGFTELADPSFWMQLDKRDKI